jgi:hypothetical protein
VSNAILSWLRPKGPSTGATGTPVTFGSARNAAPVSILWSRFLPTPSQWQDILTADGLSNIFETLNSIPGVSIPRTPITLGARVGLLKTLMEITIDVYKYSSRSRVIGGKVLTLGIHADGNYLRN